jgi:hypothetical protein
MYFFFNQFLRCLRDDYFSRLLLNQIKHVLHALNLLEIVMLLDELISEGSNVEDYAA